MKKVKRQKVKSETVKLHAFTIKRHLIDKVKHAVPYIWQKVLGASQTVSSLFLSYERVWRWVQKKFCRGRQVALSSVKILQGQASVFLPAPMALSSVKTPFQKFWRGGRPYPAPLYFRPWPPPNATGCSPTNPRTMRPNTQEASLSPWRWLF